MELIHPLSIERASRPVSWLYICFSLPMTSSPGLDSSEVVTKGPLQLPGRSACIPIRFPRSTCHECEVVCTVKALKRDSKGWSVGPSCDGCGACVGACPTGAWDLGPGTGTLLAEARAGTTPGTDFRYACDRADPGGVPGALRIPCAARLDESLVLEPLRGAASAVRVHIGDCGRCDRRDRFSAMMNAWLPRMRALLESLGRRKADLGFIPTSPTPPLSAAGAGRRGWLGKLVEAVRRPAGPTAPTVNRRARLLRVLRAWSSPTIPVPVPGTPTTGRLSINSSCIGCNVCEHVCPTEALLRTELPDGTMSLRLEPDLCVQCGACAEACLPRAISLVPASTFLGLGASSSELLITLQGRTCPECGLNHHSESDPRCPRCRREVKAPGSALVATESAR